MQNNDNLKEDDNMKWCEWWRRQQMEHIIFVYFLRIIQHIKFGGGVVDDYYDSKTTCKSKEEDEILNDALKQWHMSI